MFFLSLIEHTLRVPPHLLSLQLNDAIKGELDSLFLDKVIGELGLCVSVYDIKSIDGGFITPGEGASTYTVKFRLVMFRPFVGEIITARLKESTKDGLRCTIPTAPFPLLNISLAVSLGFFEDIYVPVHLLFSENRFEPVEGHKDSVLWTWIFEGEEYPLDASDEIRFKVHSVRYPPIPVEQDQDPQQHVKPFAPMVVTGSLDMDGLGPVSWWG